MRTYVLKPADVKRKWYLVDAEGEVLGRLASKVAAVLRGKHKPTYSPHMDVGDHVIIVNADKIRVTGKKAKNKTYFRHSGYPGGVTMEAFADLKRKHPERILEKAILGMLPHNRLGRKMYRKLKVHAGKEHCHQAQRPEKMELN